MENGERKKVVGFRGRWEEEDGVVGQEREKGSREIVRGTCGRVR